MESRATSVERGRFEPRIVMPRLLLLVFLLDLGSRFLPVDPLTFRAWEALSRFRPPGAAFEPNRHYENRHTYGDLAAMGNLPPLRQYREERFTTDGLGFRNEGVPGSADVLVVGDSFSVGSGVSDDENLTSRLSEQLRARFYNAGGIGSDPDRILALAQRLGVRESLVIREYYEDYELPTIPSVERRRELQALASIDPRWGRVWGWARGLLSVSPLGIACERAMKHVRDGSWLPNNYATNVKKATLETGDPVLFRESILRGDCSREPASAVYWKWLQGELRKGGLELLVVLAPSKYTVYRPFLRGEPFACEGGRTSLARLARDLTSAGVPVLDLTPLLASEAAAHLDRREYLYWRDDIHWTPLGTEIAARGIAARLRSSEEESDR